ncbi:MAG: DUF4270 family protein [Polaribacter sp.]|uniref:DUF4270 family protein n=1 Tax=Polaribacter sp. TaxID=1920175 RepID=UPI003266B2BE
MRKIFKKSAYVTALVLVFTVVISCEKDFTDIGSSIISNTKFSTSSFLVDVVVENSPITEVATGNIILDPGLYLLGVHSTSEYEKIEASIISQIAISASLQVIDDANVYDSDTTVVTTIDTVFLRLPYQATLNEDGDAYELDSIIGDTSKAFNLNIYETSTYLNTLNPANPSTFNTYNTNNVFDKTGSELNTEVNFQFIPKATDTAIVIRRWLSNNAISSKDTITYNTSTASTVPLPFAVVPLKEDKIKELFLDKYESAEFDSQDAFNNYFRGVILEATGDEGSLISFNFNGTVRPSIEVYYTNSVVTGGIVIDTIYKNDSFPLLGITTSNYKMEDKIYPVNDEVILQGAAGSEATVNIFGADTDANGIADKIEELRAKNLLINDASLTFYINQSSDTTAVPYQLFLFKSDENTNPSYSHIQDIYTEGTSLFGGYLERDDEDKVEKYTFRITDYISQILSGETDYSPTLRLKVANSTDMQAVTDTVYANYNWNPKAVTLFNHSASDKKVELKISYTEEKN